MTAEKNRDPITGPVSKVFFHYSIPVTMGMLCTTSATLIDGLFVGNFVGAEALAAINFVSPVMLLIYGLVFMLDTGASVIAGKYIGEGKLQLASESYSAALIGIVLLILLVVVPSLVFMPELLFVLGIQGHPLITTLASEYLSTFLLFVPFICMGPAFMMLLQTDNHPRLASAAMVLTAASNVALNWLLVDKLDMGMTGAAVATGLAALPMWLALLVYIRSPKRSLTFTRPQQIWPYCKKASINGVSELGSEASYSVTTVIFNWAIMATIGAQGVTAFTIINYVLLLGLMAAFGISDSIRPVLSKNLGARQPERIYQFAKLSVTSALAIGLLIILSLFLFPRAIITLFVAADEHTLVQLTQDFIGFLWPAFLFLGINVVATAYQTAMHRPLESFIISFVRTLLFPVVLVLSLPLWFGDKGIFLALPIAEVLCFLIAIYYFRVNRPTKIVQAINLSA
ncbi:putative efflux protein, MATE family [Microbulbifer donghaiensis]|uniref:Putative efflux protein, MATE family n=1 Tax=Microbulbifer donghaiensis TaxID=494016 RepID=A0A1M4UJI3_9GAMM|nr:MATE family efflux transporter [Microbulbifer donghaiensis]SHE56857.1 putative efflux protein, MATE family [Microbulbifer donghaiensis]